MNASQATQPRADAEVVAGQVYVQNVDAAPTTSNRHIEMVSKTMEPAGAVAVTAYMQAMFN